MGIGASVGDDGSESRTISWDARGGGGLLAAEPNPPSSDRSELFGMMVVLLLRERTVSERCARRMLVLDLDYFL